MPPPGNYILHAITVNRFSAPNRSNNTFRARLTRDLTLVCTRAAQPYRPDSRHSTTRGARRTSFSLSLSLSFLHLATHYPVSVHERVSPINLSGESRLNLEREFYLASFNCSMEGTMRHGGRFSCSWSRDRQRRRFSSTRVWRNSNFIVILCHRGNRKQDEEANSKNGNLSTWLMNSTNKTTVHEILIRFLIYIVDAFT